MADPTSIIQSVISGVLTGGASAGTALLAVFKDIKKRLAEVEAKVGSDKADPKTGIYYSLEVLNDSVRRLRRDIDGWRDDPPDWLVRLVQSAARRSSVSMEHQHELEQRVEQRLRAFAQTLKRLEEDLDAREQRLEDAVERSNPGARVFVTREEYENDSLRRAAEMSKVRENLASSNVWLRGVLTALGYIDSEPTPTPKAPVVGLPPPKRK